MPEERCLGHVYRDLRVLGTVCYRWLNYLAQMLEARIHCRALDLGTDVKMALHQEPDIRALHHLFPRFDANFVGLAVLLTSNSRLRMSSLV